MPARRPIPHTSDPKGEPFAERHRKLIIALSLFVTALSVVAMGVALSQEGAFMRFSFEFGGR